MGVACLGLRRILCSDLQGLPSGSRMQTSWGQESYLIWSFVHAKHIVRTQIWLWTMYNQSLRRGHGVLTYRCSTVFLKSKSRAFNNQMLLRKYFSLEVKLMMEGQLCLVFSDNVPLLFCITVLWNRHQKILLKHYSLSSLPNPASWQALKVWDSKSYFQ